MRTTALQRLRDRDTLHVQSVRPRYGQRTIKRLIVLRRVRFMRITDPILAKKEAYSKLRSILNQWNIPYIGVRNNVLHNVFQVGRFHLYPYWRPLTRDYFEQMTMEYIGPYIPIFWSERETIRDDTIDGDYYYYNRIYRDYRFIYPYFYCPAFIVLPEWPDERQWVWTPVIRTTPNIIKSALNKEVLYGGWSKNSRGRTRVPQRTGTTGLSRIVKNGQGWATYRPESVACLSVNRE